MKQFLESRYVRGARGPEEYDCWGLVRAARVQIFGKSLLPECTDALPGNLKEITKAFREVVFDYGFTVARMAPGTIAAAWRSNLCVHVGIVVEVDGRNWILETDEPTGPCLTKITTFESKYTKVTYHDD